MRKLRLIIRIITAGLVVLTIIGVVLLIANRKLDFLDTTYEAIAFTVGMGGMIMAVVSQIDSYQQEKITRKTIQELTELNREADDDEKVDKAFQQKLDRILEQDTKIYRELQRQSKK